MCDLLENDEYSTHHEFSNSITEHEEKHVESLKSFLSEKSSFLDPGKLCHVISGKVLTNEESQFLLSCNKNGETMYKQYRQQRIVDKSAKLFDRIPKPKINNLKHRKEQEIKDNLQAETLALVRAVDVARVQGSRT